MPDNTEHPIPDFNKESGSPKSEDPTKHEALWRPNNPPQQGYGGYPGYQSYPQYDPHHYPHPGQYMVNMEGKKKADLALILAIIGFFVAPLFLGVVGLIISKQAEDLGGDAKIAKIISWVDVGYGLLVGVFFTIFFIAALASGY